MSGAIFISDDLVICCCYCCCFLDVIFVDVDGESNIESDGSLNAGPDRRVCQTGGAGPEKREPHKYQAVPQAA